MQIYFLLETFYLSPSCSMFLCVGYCLPHTCTHMCLSLQGHISHSGQTHKDMHNMHLIWFYIKTEKTGLIWVIEYICSVRHGSPEEAESIGRYVDVDLASWRMKPTSCSKLISLLTLLKAKRQHSI